MKVWRRGWFRFGVGALLLIGAAYAGNRVYYASNDGFKVANIRRDHESEARWEVHQLDPSQMAQLRQILGQRFSYLAKGGQAYAFVSEDERYVLKFFKYQHTETRPWVNWFSFIPAVDAYRQERIARKGKCIDSAYAGWKLAFDVRPEQTGVLYAHINKTRGEWPTVTLVDKMGLSHQIDLDRVEFLLQRRAQMLEPTLQELIEQGELSAGQELIDQIVAFYEADYREGYTDRDPCLMRNTGLCDGRPIHVDVGQLSQRSQPITEPDQIRHKLRSKTRELSSWLHHNSPSLAAYLDQKLTNQL
jgi:hypothetical protein